MPALCRLPVMVPLLEKGCRAKSLLYLCAEGMRGFGAEYGELMRDAQGVDAHASSRDSHMAAQLHGTGADDAHMAAHMHARALQSRISQPMCAGVLQNPSAPAGQYTGSELFRMHTKHEMRIETHRTCIWSASCKRQTSPALPKQFENPRHSQYALPTRNKKAAGQPKLSCRHTSRLTL